MYTLLLHMEQLYLVYLNSRKSQGEGYGNTMGMSQQPLLTLRPAMIYAIFLSCLCPTPYLRATQITFVKLATLLPRYDKTSPCILVLTQTTLTEQPKPRFCLYEALAYLARQKAERCHFQSQQFKLYILRVFIKLFVANSQV